MGEGGRCTAKERGSVCRKAMGHTGMHESDDKLLRWGGRYRPSELSGKAGVMKDAAKDQSARRRRPRGERCSICCQEGRPLKNGVCADREACEAACAPLF